MIDFYARQRATPIEGVPKFDPTRVVDGQRHIIFLKPLPTTSEGKTFEARTKVAGVYDKGKAGTVVETETSIVDKSTGETYTKAIGSAFYVGQGNWGGPKGMPRQRAETLSFKYLIVLLGPATVNFPPPEGKKPDAISVTQLTPSSAHLYRLVVKFRKIITKAIY